MFTQPEIHIESVNPQIMTLAEDLSRDTPSICQQVRLFYDYIGDELVYTYNGKNWERRPPSGRWALIARSMPRCSWR